MSNTTRGKYNTKHRDELISYLETLEGVHFTASDIYEHFKSCEKSMGIATIYRQLDKLISEGLVTKYEIDQKSSACFEYVHPEKHVHSHSCFHLRCTKCEKLIHLDCDDLENIQSHLLKEHEFTLDPKRTVFYGICKSCSKGGNQ